MVANTEEAPQPGRFYVLRDGGTVYSGRDFQEAITAYRQLVREYWEKRIGAADRDTALIAAAGLLDLDPHHRAALEVAHRLGDAALLKRLDQRRKKDISRRRQEAMTARRKAAAGNRAAEK